MVSKARTTKPKKAPKETKGPTFAEIGRKGAYDAQRRALLAELKKRKWNLSATAEALSMGTASTVIRAIRKLDLDDEYEAARERGDVRPGSRD